MEVKVIGAMAKEELHSFSRVTDFQFHGTEIKNSCEAKVQKSCFFHTYYALNMKSSIQCISVSVACISLSTPIIYDILRLITDN